MSSTAVVSPATRHQTPRPGSQRNGGVRLTRRGRLVVLGTVLLGSMGVFAQVGSSPAESTGVVHHPHLATVIVQPGQTVWDIARSVSEDADPRQVVAEIEDLNALTDAGSIRVGQPLYVPAS